MQDVFAYCAQLVRRADRDRYLATLFAPAERRGAVHALFAFNVEIGRVRDAAREALPGEIRLQWWSDVLNGERGEEAAANPVAAALLATIDAHRLPAGTLSGLIEAHRFDLYDEPMSDMPALESHARATASALFALAAQILAGGDATPAAAPAGMATTLARVLQALPRHAARRQLYLPLDLLARHDVSVESVFAQQVSAGLQAVLDELRRAARAHLAQAGERIAALPPAALPAFLPLALIGPTLDRLERSDAFRSPELSAWRRQWLIWRAARKPARMTRGTLG